MAEGEGKDEAHFWALLTAAKKRHDDEFKRNDGLCPQRLGSSSSPRCPKPIGAAVSGERGKEEKLSMSSEPLRDSAQGLHGSDRGKRTRDSRPSCPYRGEIEMHAAASSSTSSSDSSRTTFVIGKSTLGCEATLGGRGMLEGIVSDSEDRAETCRRNQPGRGKLRHRWGWHREEGRIERSPLLSSDEASNRDDCWGRTGNGGFPRSGGEEGAFQRTKTGWSGLEVVDGPSRVLKRSGSDGNICSSPLWRFPPQAVSALARRWQEALLSPYIQAGFSIVEHTVTETDTLFGIALRYDVAPQELRAINMLGNSDEVWSRSTIRVPSRRNPPPITGSLEHSSSESRRSQHTPCPEAAAAQQNDLTAAPRASYPPAVGRCRSVEGSPSLQSVAGRRSTTQPADSKFSGPGARAQPLLQQNEELPNSSEDLVETQRQRNAKLATNTTALQRLTGIEKVLARNQLESHHPDDFAAALAGCERLQRWQRDYGTETSVQLAFLLSSRGDSEEALRRFLQEREWKKQVAAMSK